jgi:hypothetical protein
MESAPGLPAIYRQETRGALFTFERRDNFAAVGNIHWRFEMKRHIDVVLIFAFWSAIPGPTQALAQQVNSFELLQLLVKPGDKIEVIGTDGVSSRGRIESLTPSSLRLTTKSGFRDYAQKDALEVRQKRGDSLANGAWIGAASGGGLAGGLAIAYCGGGECDGGAGQIAAVVAAYTGIGVAIGVGIDAMIRHRQTIYKQTAQTTLKSVRVAPLVSNRSKGVALRFSF